MSRPSLESVVKAAVVAVGVIFTAAFAWYSVAAHAKDAVVHLDPEKSRELGGAAYSKQVEALERDHRDVKRMLNNLKIRCTSARNAGLDCSISVEEPIGR